MKAELRSADEGVGGVRRILGAQIAEALAALEGKRIDASDIHSARKALKKARATLRLLRYTVPDRTYRKENAALRDAARPLSALRDAKVLIDALDNLEKLYGAPAAQSIPAAFRRTLAREQTDTRKRALGATGGLRSSRELMSKSARRVSRLATTDEGWTPLGRGLERVYGGGRDALQILEDERPTEALHEWRKQSKYLWHQLQLLEPLWPGPIGELADQLHKLSDYLGDDHDLAVLRERVQAHAKVFPETGGAGALLALIDRCRKRLQAKALVLGRRIYDEKPGTFAARYGRYWKRWKRETSAG